VGDVVAGRRRSLAQTLLERAVVPALRIDTDVDLGEPFQDTPATAPAFHVCDGFEDEAAAAAAQVLVHVERGETPVALIAQDRASCGASAPCSNAAPWSCATRPAGSWRRRAPARP